MNIKTNKGQAALMFATCNGHTETAEILIRHGTDINIQNSKELTALMYAAWYGHTETAVMLIQYGADVNITALHFGTALDFWAAYQTDAQIRRKVLLASQSYRTYPLCLFIFGYDFQPLPLGAVIDLATAPTNFGQLFQRVFPDTEAVENSLAADIVTYSGVDVHTSWTDTIDPSAGSSVVSRDNIAHQDRIYRALTSSHGGMNLLTMAKYI